MVISLGRFGLKDSELILIRDFFFVAGRIFEVNIACVIAYIGVAVRAILIIKRILRLIINDIKINKKWIICFIKTIKLKAIKSVDETTHVFYADELTLLSLLWLQQDEKTDSQIKAYAGHGSDYGPLKDINVSLLTTATKAITQLCPNLAFWTLQTGGKVYGTEFYGQEGIEIKTPLKESNSRIPEPYASKVFYYPQYDLLAKLSEGQKWKFCEIRPDVIVGFTPHSNGMGFAQALGIFLSIYASFEGEGAEVEFPGIEASWKALHSDTSQDLLAQFHIYASLAPEKVSEKAINVADEVTSWEKVWPGICSYFGLKGVGPREGSEKKALGVQWTMDHQADWGKWVEENGLKKGLVETSSWEMMAMVTGYGVFDREYDLSLVKEVGFQEQTSTVAGYHLAFDRMRKAKIIA